jgi:uncharacterized membrane protein YgcG
VPARLAQWSPRTPPEIQTTAASPLDHYQPNGNVNDFAGLMDADSKTELGSSCRKLNDEKKVQVVILTDRLAQRNDDIALTKRS